MAFLQCLSRVGFRVRILAITAPHFIQSATSLVQLFCNICVYDTVPVISVSFPVFSLYLGSYQGS